MILVTGANGQLSRALQKELINDEYILPHLQKLMMLKFKKN